MHASPTAAPVKAPSSPPNTAPKTGNGRADEAAGEGPTPDRRFAPFDVVMAAEAEPAEAEADALAAQIDGDLATLTEGTPAPAGDAPEIAPLSPQVSDETAQLEVVAAREVAPVRVPTDNPPVAATGAANSELQPLQPVKASPLAPDAEVAPQPQTSAAKVMAPQAEANQALVGQRNATRTLASAQSDVFSTDIADADLLAAQTSPRAKGDGTKTLEQPLLKPEIVTTLAERPTKAGLPEANLAEAAGRRASEPALPPREAPTTSVRVVAADIPSPPKIALAASTGLEKAFDVAAPFPIEGELAPIASTPVEARASATAPLLPTVSAARDPGAAIAQIAAAVARVGGDRVEVRLDPPELGRVVLNFVIRDDQVVAQVSADRHETADLLRRNGDELQRSLRDGGFENISLEFGAENEEADTEQGASAASAESQDAEVAQPRKIFVRGALDIRV